MMAITLAQVPSFYQGYVRKVMDRDLMDALTHTQAALVQTCEKLSEAEGQHRYAAEKWSIKDLVQHLIDSERIFSYRALRFARKDTTELSGFDQDAYVPAAGADGRTMQALLQEFANLRQSTLDLFRSLDAEARSRAGTSNHVEMTAEVLGYVIAGHTLHHTEVIQSKYLS